MKRNKRNKRNTGCYAEFGAMRNTRNTLLRLGIQMNAPARAV
jgi:hypothetical protein